MSYDLSQVDQDELISLRFWGNPDRSEHLEARSAVAELSKSTGYQRLIVDMTESESFMSGSTPHLFSFGKEFALNGFPRDLSIAVVNEKGRNRDIEFVVTVARNRGVNMRLFLNPEEALTWLQE